MTKPRPPDVCRLTLMIRGVCYRLRRLPSEDGAAWRLTKADGTVYDVRETLQEPVCDCGDHAWNGGGRRGHFCKHIRSLRAVGLIEWTHRQVSADRR